jgi:hypothetical protein
MQESPGNGQINSVGMSRGVGTRSEQDWQPYSNGPTGERDDVCKIRESTRCT